MKIALNGPSNQFSTALRDHLRHSLSGHTLVDWNTKDPHSNADVEILLSLGPVTRQDLQSAPKLALIQTVSDGYETVDVDAATDLGIWVSFSPGDETGNADSVAEYAVLLLLAASRRLNLALAAIHDPSKRPMLNSSLVGKSVCIVGPGSIGQKLASRLQPFGVHLTSVDRHPDHVPAELHPQPLDHLQQALSTADYVVLCIRATADNHNMIDASILASMKPGSTLINIARGSLVDESALLAAVQSGHLAAAGLDVLQHEPVTPANPLLSQPTVFITPHIAGFTDLTLDGTTHFLTEVVENFQQNKRPASLLNHPGNPRHPLN